MRNPDRILLYPGPGDIVILDHRDCGAYRHPKELNIPPAILDVGLPKDVLPSVEQACHQAVLDKLIPMPRKQLDGLVPDLEYHSWLLARNEGRSIGNQVGMD